MAISIGKAWDESRDILTRDGKLILTIGAAMLMLPTALVALVSPQAVGAEPPAPGIMGTAVQILSFLLTQTGVLALIALALRPNLSVGESIRAGLSRLLPTLAAFLLYILPMVFLLGIIFGATVGGDTPEAMLANLRSAGGGASLAILLWAVAFVYLGVRFLLANAVALAESANPITILKRSWQLSRGAYFKLFLFMLLWGILLLTAQMATAAVTGVLVGLTLGAPEPFSVAALLTGLIAGAVNMMVVIVYALMVARIYAQRVTIDSVPNVEDVFR